MNVLKSIEISYPDEHLTSSRTLTSVEAGSLYPAYRFGQQFLRPTKTAILF